MWKYSFIFAISAAISASLCPIAERIALRAGAVDLPGGRHVHPRPTPRLGGLAVGLGLFLSLLAGSGADAFIHSVLAVNARDFILLGSGAALVLLTGAIDDLRQLRPGIKLVAEIFAGIVVVLAGHQIQFAFGFDLGWLRAGVTVLWLVAVVNAINMIDGLDGLAGGVGFIIGTTLFAVSIYLGSVTSGLILVALCGGIAGFLPFNLSPARIFLGDSGSLLIGYCLAVTSIQSSSKSATLVAIAFPLLALGLPLAELVTTTIRRVLRTIHVVRLDDEAKRYEFFFIGRPALFAADRDHIHHRLLALGLGPRRTVLVLYAICATFGIGAFAMVTFEGVNLALLLAAFGILTMACLHQLRYKELQPLAAGLLLPLFDTVQANRKIVQGVTDLASAAASILIAFAIHNMDFGDGTRSALRANAPLIVLVQIGSLAASGVYRRAFRHSGLPDLVAVAKALIIAIVSGWAVSAIVFNRAPVPLTVWVLDAYLLITLILLSRFSFLLLDYVFKSTRSRRRRVMIVGAGRAGAAAFREVQFSPELDMKVVGFIDEDIRKAGQLLNGVPVHNVKTFSEMIEKHQFDEAIVAKADDGQMNDILRLCEGSGIRVSRFVVDFKEVRGKPAKAANDKPLLVSDARVVGK